MSNITGVWIDVDAVYLPGLQSEVRQPSKPLHLLSGPHFLRSLQLSFKGRTTLQRGGQSGKFSDLSQFLAPAAYTGQIMLRK